MTIRNETVFVGIDVSKAHVDIAIHERAEVRRFDNQGAGLRTALAWLAEFEVALVVVEATGRLHEMPTRLMRAAGLAVAVLNPGRVRHFARAKGRLAKTDKLDALVLAEYAAVIRPAPGQARDAATEQLAPWSSAAASWSGCKPWRRIGARTSSSANAKPASPTASRPS